MLTNSFLVVLDVIAGEPLKSKISLFLCLILSFFFSLMFLPQILNISRRKQLYDTPNRRKCHHERIPRLGGLAFFPSIVLSMSLVVGYRYLIGFQMNHQLNGNILLEFLFLSAGCLFLYMTGVEDDLIGVRYRKKFFIQFAVASLLPVSGFYLDNLYGLFGVYILPEYIAIPFTVLLIVFITNAVNLTMARRIGSGRECFLFPGDWADVFSQRVMAIFDVGFFGVGLPDSLSIF